MDIKVKPDIRELTLRNGLEFPNDEELVMMILGTGTKEFPIRSMARAVNNAVDESFGNDLLESLRKIKGMGDGKILQIAAAVEYGRRKHDSTGNRISHPSDVVPFVANFSLKKKEYFLGITLNGNHEIIQIHVLSVGTVTSSVVYPREVFGVAMNENAAAIILCHNHPSGNLEPSEQDIETTDKLLKASEIIGIPILDHIIINSMNYYSFLEHGLLFTSG